MLLQVKQDTGLGPEKLPRIGDSEFACFSFQNNLQSLAVEDGDISYPAETVHAFALIFRNDFKQADNVVTQLQGILEAAGT